MSQSSAQRAQTADDQSESPPNKPTVLADNGHGTKVKLWSNKTDAGGEFQTVSIERSYKPKGSEEYKTDRVSLSGDELLTVARGLEKGHDQITEKNIARLNKSKG